MATDRVTTAMVAAAERLNREYCTRGDLGVAVRSRVSVPWIVQGFAVEDNWTDVFEPVRRRLPFAKKWTMIAPVEQAAACVGTFLRDRPDLSERRG